MTKPRPIPTLQDVADKSGVSTATVSRCLNFPDQVAAKTRDRVMEAVRALGYSPNFGARMMAAKRTFTFGAIIPTMENAMFARGLQAFQEELHDKGYTLLVASSSYRADIEEEQIRTLVARGAEGLLLIGHGRDPAIYDFLDAQGVPALVTWAVDRAEARPSVGFDNRAAMRAMAEKVLSLGHRRIGVINVEVSSNDRARARLEGIRDAINATEGTTLQLIQTPYGIENGAAAFERLMTAALPPTVVIAGNDALAVGALRQARVMGLDVPGDVSVTGFADIELAQVAVPSLTTVHVPHQEMGRRAARALIGRVQDGVAFQTQELAAELRLRESLGPPPTS